MVKIKDFGFTRLVCFEPERGKTDVIFYLYDPLILNVSNFILSKKTYYHEGWVKLSQISCF